MILRLLRGLLLSCLGLLALPAAAQGWQEGVHYERIEPAVPGSAPAGRIEVVEVFSYGCPYCFQAQPFIDQLKAALPAEVSFRYVHASFNAAEAWPTFQRAYLTAVAMGIADAHHQALLDAVWRTGEVRLIDPATRRLANPLPDLPALARFYAARAGIREQDFLARAASPEIDAAVRRDDALVRAWAIPGTPNLVVNGRYRTGRVRNFDELTRVVEYLVALEQARTAP